MSIFDNFTNKARRLEAAEKAFHSAEKDIASFREKSTGELRNVLAKFAEEGLFPKIDTSHQLSTLKPSARNIAIERINLCGEKLQFGENVNKDKIGSRLAEEIVLAAYAKKIPVVHKFTAEGQNIEVSEHVKEREKCPEILLNALAAYADTKDKPVLAEMAREAANRMKKLVSSLQELQ